jgi:hypothetical protein
VRTPNDHRQLWPTRVRGIGPPATGPEVAPVQLCLRYRALPEPLRGPVACQRPRIGPHPRREPNGDSPHPLPDRNIWNPRPPGSGRRSRRRPALVPPGRFVGLGPGSRYFGGWKNSGALGEAEARWPDGTGPANFCLPGGQEHGAQRSVPGPGNEGFALPGWTKTGQCLVAVHRPPGF